MAIAATILALCAAAAADAASYTIWSCRGPDGAALATDAWEPAFSDGGTSDTCATDGSLRARIRPADNAPYSIRGYRFALPAGAKIAGYRIHLYAATGSSWSLLDPATGDSWSDRLRQAGVDSDAGSAIEVDAGCLISGCVFGEPGDPLASSNLLAASGLTSAGLAVVARCGSQWGCHPQDGEPTLAEVRLFRSQVDVADDEAPLLGPASGSLASSVPLTAEASLEATATDGGGGVASIELLIDGAAAARRDAGASCSEPYVTPAPCPAKLTAGFTLSAASLAPGAHVAALRATDAAGNAATGAPTQFTVGEPAPSAATLAEHAAQVPVAPERVAISVARRRLILSRDGVRFAGVVKDRDGKAVPGARVTVGSRPFGVRRTKLRLESVLTAGADGRFSATVRGRSRLLVLDVDDAKHRAIEPAEIELMESLRVRVFVARKGVRNGSAMRLRARIEGAGAGVAGKALIVMTTVRGRWTAIGSLTTDEHGEAVWRYRFGGTVIHALYRFRVRVEHAGDIWPWRTTDSRTVIVEVSPDGRAR